MIREVKTIVALLLKRPITEEIAMQVGQIPGYKKLEIADGNWILDSDKDDDDVTTGEEHGWIESILLILLGSHVIANKLGRVYPGDVTFVLQGDASDIRQQREPDVSFVKQENVTPSQGFIYGAPDLAVEIVSPSQSEAEMVAKAQDYFRFGTQVVWLVFPRQKTIQVHTPTNVHTYGMGEMIPGGELLPGFSLSVAQVFEM